MAQFSGISLPTGNLYNFIFQITRCLWTKTQHNLVLLHCCERWGHTWMRRCCRLTLHLQWPLWYYCRFPGRMKNASGPHHQASRCGFYMYRCTRQLSVRESFGVRSPRQYFQVSTWLVCEIVIDNTGLRETEHPSSVSGVYPYVSALQGRGCSWV